MSFWSVGLQFRVVEGPNKGRTYPLDAQEITIGRARAAGDRAPGWMLLMDETVSRIHAELRWLAEYEAYSLSNRSEINPTRVNDQIITDLVLKAGDQVKVGNTVLDLQQADFRFAGLRPPSALAHRPNLQFCNPPPGQEERVPTHKPRVVALTTRPELQLVCLAGMEQGCIWPISGTSIVFGGPPTPNPSEEDEEQTLRLRKAGDQELVSSDERIPPRALLLVWKELDGAFELSRLKDGLTLRVTLERSLDGADWVAELPPESPVCLRKNDILWLADTAFHLVSP